jgi:methylenetetrahydrofolate dehydrogenase (NADP+)/methenyltetrahydrofolate cyclohydrolase
MTSPLILDGRKTALQIEAEITPHIHHLRSRGITPKLVFIRVGDNLASIAYITMKNKKAHTLGIATDNHILPTHTTQEQLTALIQSLNDDPTTHAILIQSPLPPHLSEIQAFSTVAPQKDVDGFHPINAGKLLLGDPTGFRPCTPAGIHELLTRHHIPTQGKLVAIIGRGNIVGKPLAAILIQKTPTANATVLILHSQSQHLPALSKQADILVAALGRPHFITPDYIKPGAVVIDVGVNRIPDPTAPNGYRLIGDVHFPTVAPLCSAITPNPGGVGPMTIAMLMANTIRAAQLQNP